jgi:hypothetical protein
MELECYLHHWDVGMCRKKLLIGYFIKLLGFMNTSEEATLRYSCCRLIPGKKMLMGLIGARK